MHHLLIHCTVAYNLGSFVFRCFGIHWVLLGKVMYVMFGCRNWVGKYTSTIWNMVILCSKWTIWKVCNRCTFEVVECMRILLLVTLSSSLFAWSQAWGFTHCVSISMFLESCPFCT